MTILALGSAVGGSLGALYDYQQSAQAGLPESRGLGASGMVEGIMMATMLAQPRWPVRAYDAHPLRSPEPFGSWRRIFSSYWTNIYRLLDCYMKNDCHSLTQS